MLPIGRHRPCTFTAGKPQWSLFLISEFTWKVVKGTTSPDDSHWQTRKGQTLGFIAHARDKKHLTFSVWSAEVMPWDTRGGTSMCLSLADIKWQGKSIYHMWQEDNWTRQNQWWRCNHFLAPRALSKYASDGRQDHKLIGRDCFLWPH